MLWARPCPASEAATVSAVVPFRSPERSLQRATEDTLEPAGSQASWLPAPEASPTLPAQTLTGCGAGGMPGAQRVPSCPLDSDRPPWQPLPTLGSTPPGVSSPTPGGSQPGPKHPGALVMRFQPQSLGSRLRSQGLRGWLNRTFGQKGSIWEAGCPRPPQGGNPMPPCLWPGPSDGTVLVSFSPGVPLAPGLPREGQEGSL